MIWDFEEVKMLKKLKYSFKKIDIFEDIFFSHDYIRNVYLRKLNKEYNFNLIKDLKWEPDFYHQPKSNEDYDKHSKNCSWDNFCVINSNTLLITHYGTLAFYDINSTSIIKKSSKYSNNINKMIYDPNAHLVATVEDNIRIMLWQVDPDKLDIKYMKALFGHSVAITCILFNGDASLLYSSSAAGTVRIWNIESGSVIKMIGNHQLSLYNSNFSKAIVPKHLKKFLEYVSRPIKIKIKHEGDNDSDYEDNDSTQKNKICFVSQKIGECLYAFFIPMLLTLCVYIAFIIANALIGGVVTSVGLIVLALGIILCVLDIALRCLFDILTGIISGVFKCKCENKIHSFDSVNDPDGLCDQFWGGDYRKRGWEIMKMGIFHNKSFSLYITGNEYTLWGTISIALYSAVMVPWDMLSSAGMGIYKVIKGKIHPENSCDENMQEVLESSCTLMRMFSKMIEEANFENENDNNILQD